MHIVIICRGTTLEHDEETIFQAFERHCEIDRRHRQQLGQGSRANNLQCSSGSPGKLSFRFYNLSDIPTDLGQGSNGAG